MSEKWKFMAKDFGHPIYGTTNQKIVAADLANALLQEWLAESPVVTGVIQKDQSISVSKWDEWAPGIEPHKNDTHRGRLIMIEPIVKDTAEEFIKDLVATILPPFTDKWMDRARKLLTKSESDPMADAYFRPVLDKLEEIVKRNALERLERLDGTLEEK